MKDSKDTSGLYLVLGLALAGAFGFGLYLIGPSTLQTVAIILGVSLGLAVIIIAGAVFVRQWRRNDAAPIVQEHFIHDGTRTIERHTIDGTQQKPVLYQLPAQQQGGVYPDLMRAAWQAGLLADRRAGAQSIEGEAREIPPDEWPGGIKP